MNAKKKSSLGLESIGDLSGLLDQPETTKSFGPLDLALELIDEDPDPRPATVPMPCARSAMSRRATACSRWI
jgi:ParB family transcriptional regulator, chromosome partitioning protein